MNATLVRLTRLAADFAHAPDGQLLDAFLAGSQAAFRELVIRHGPLVFAVCDRVLHHRQDSEDAFQAVFLVLARRAADVWPREAVGSWLYGVARRVALKARSARARRQTREQPLEDAPRPPSPTPEPDLPEIIDRAVRWLPEAYRAAVVACDLEGLSRAEAAERLGWKEGTLSGRLARARQLLAARLRKSGLELPAALAGVLGTNAAARAGLVDSVVELVSAGAAGVSGPVAALTEGVVPSMFAFKLKAAVAAVVVACAVGYGAWAGGTGQAPGAGPNEKIVPLAPIAAQPPRPKAEPPAKPDVPPDLEPFQGRWRIHTIAEGKTVTPAWKWDEPGIVEVTGNVLTLPYLEAGGGRKQQEFKIAVGDETARTINLIAPGKPLARGIYEFTAPAMTCGACHTHPFPGQLFPIPKDVIGLCGPGLKQRTGLKLAVATAGVRPTKFGSGAEGVIEFTLERLGPDGKPVAAAGADELAALQGEWIIGRRPHDRDTVVSEDKAKALLADARKRHELVTIKGDTMDWPLVTSSAGSISGEGTGGTSASSTSTDVTPRKFRIAVSPGKGAATNIDLIDDRGIKRYGIFQFEDGYLMLVLAEHRGRPESVEKRVISTEPMWTLWQPQPTPAAKQADERARLERNRAKLMALLESAAPEEEKRTALRSLLRLQLIEAESGVEAARTQLKLAAARCDQAQVLVEQANAEFTLASRNLQVAQAKLEAQKAAAEADKKPLPAPPAKDGDTFSVHVRPLAAAEKVIRVKATGKETVLEGLAYAAEDMAIKAESLSVWVVRGKEILPVDLAAITQKGVTATNYVLKSGDQLFVQVKLGK